MTRQRGSASKESSQPEAGVRTLSFLFRHWAAILISALLILAVLTGYRMWRVGFPDAMSRADALIIYVALIPVVVVVRYGIGPYAITVISKRRASLQKKVAQDVLEQGRSQAKGMLNRGVQSAGGAYARFRKRARREWNSVTRRKPASNTMVAPSGRECPSCGRVVRSGAKFCDRCGTALAFSCPNCGRNLLPGSKFCDRCGEQTQ